jgi:Resolvase, N terminal domain
MSYVEGGAWPSLQTQGAEEKRAAGNLLVRLTLIGVCPNLNNRPNLALQQDALKTAGCEKVFTDAASGSRTDRPGLAEAKSFARDGDTLIVWRLDRLGAL